ncbi:MAG: single-stranded-DNA-specific exonuclease RecJ [Armatimonadetes bacterium]|nr:single-stranded-DNA-specific exonuclease RecJ [Armatimonadota bacterium]
MPAAPTSLFAAVPGVPPILAQLLYNRGLLDGAPASPDALDRFLNPRWATGLHDPFLLKDMDRAVERTLAAIERREPIGIFGHYDADGITAMVVLTETLTRLGAHAVPYLPRRADDYGVHQTGIGELAAQGVRLLVTVDCGIRSFGAPETAAQAGMDVIVTDHHTVLRRDGRDRLPPALAVVNPLRADCPYPCKSLAGVGLAFKLAQALLRAHADRTGNGETHFAKWLLDLVCIGTIADVVDITGENRTLVRLGLEILRQTKRPGLKTLMGVAGTNVGSLSVGAVGFQIAPRINAAARMESPETSLALLRARDRAEAEPFARELDQLNRQRQRLTEEAMQDVLERYGDRLTERKAIVATGRWPGGILGLVAGKLCEEHRRPAAVIEVGRDELHGSARSPASFHIANALAQCEDLLSRYGGHAQAAGFSLPAANLEAFTERLTELADAHIPEADLEPVISVDALVEPAQVGADLLSNARALEPCGPGNPAPVFGMRRVPLLQAQAMGPRGAHLRLRLGAPDRPLKAVFWRMGALVEQLPAGAPVDVAFSLEKDPYSGLSLNLVDIGW